jgi:fucose permease
VSLGVEVTTGGWIVTYIIEKRGGGQSSGYVSSGFFAGLTVGRVGLLWLNKMVSSILHPIWISSLLSSNLAGGRVQSYIPLLGDSTRVRTPPVAISDLTH